MNDELNEELSAARIEIDAIDSQLLDLLNRRAHCARKIGKIKTAHGEGDFVYRPEREAQVLRRIREKNAGPLPDESVLCFFREIMSACLSLERPLSVAFLGPPGTFSESAAIKHFGHAVVLASQTSIDGVFREAEAGRADFAEVTSSQAKPNTSATSDPLAPTPTSPSRHRKSP